MASSEKSGPFQEALACQLCAVTTTITVKCMDCNIFMCNGCKEKHSKFKDADLHKVIDIKHLSSFEHQNNDQLDYKSVKCQEHKDKICYMYCSECKEMVCSTCISSNHKKHDLEEIENICRLKEDAFKRSCTKMDTDIEQCLETMKSIREREFSKYQEIKRKAKDEEKLALEKVQMQFVYKLNVADKQWEKCERQLSEKQEILTKKQKEIHALRSEFQDAFDQRNPELIMKTIGDFDDSCKTFSIPSLELTPYILEMEPSDDIDITLERHFTIKSIVTISSDQENFIWIASDKNIWKIDPSNVKTVETYKAPGNIGEIRCTCSVGAFLLVSAGTCIHILTYTGRFDIFRDFKPYKPGTIHISNECKIVVGMEFLDEMDTENKPVIVSLGADGKVLKEHKNIKKQLLKYTNVQCCTSLKDGSIVYNDRSCIQDIGRTICLDANGGVQWIYSGREKFNPIEVLATKLNNIIVSDDALESCLHILSATGNLLRLIDLRAFAIEEGVVMTLDKNYCLWTAGDYHLNCFKIIGF